MRYHIDYVGYQGVFLDDEQNVRATLDFVTGFTTVHLGGGDIQLPPPDCELQMGLLDIVGHKSERKAFDLDVPARPHPDKALRHFFDWYDEAKTLLQDAYVVGDLMEREAYDKYIERVWRSGIVDVALLGSAAVTEGKLCVSKGALDEVFVVPMKHSYYGIFEYREDALKCARPRQSPCNKEIISRTICCAERAVQEAMMSATTFSDG